MDANEKQMQERMINKMVKQCRKEFIITDIFFAMGLCAAMYMIKYPFESIFGNVLIWPVIIIVLVGEFRDIIRIIRKQKEIENVKELLQIEENILTRSQIHNDEKGE